MRVDGEEDPVEMTGMMVDGEDHHLVVIATEIGSLLGVMIGTDHLSVGMTIGYPLAVKTETGSHPAMIETDQAQGPAMVPVMTEALVKIETDYPLVIVMTEVPVMTEDLQAGEMTETDYHLDATPTETDYHPVEMTEHHQAERTETEHHSETRIETDAHQKEEGEDGETEMRNVQHPAGRVIVHHPLAEIARGIVRTLVKAARRKKKLPQNLRKMRKSQPLLMLMGLLLLL